MLRWVIQLIYDVPALEAKSLQVGDRINTPHGWGTVRSGCLNVELDKVHSKWHSKGRCIQGYNIDKISLTS